MSKKRLTIKAINIILSAEFDEDITQNLLEGFSDEEQKIYLDWMLTPECMQEIRERRKRD